MSEAVFGSINPIFVCMEGLVKSVHVKEMYNSKFDLNSQYFCGGITSLQIEIQKRTNNPEHLRNYLRTTFPRVNS